MRVKDYVSNLMSNSKSTAHLRVILIYEYVKPTTALWIFPYHSRQIRWPVRNLINFNPKFIGNINRLNRNFSLMLSNHVESGVEI